MIRWVVYPLSLNNKDFLMFYLINIITTVQRNYSIGSVDLNRNHSSDVLV